MTAVRASTDTGNLASIRVIEKLGFQLAARRSVAGLDTVFYERQAAPGESRGPGRRHGGGEMTQDDGAKQSRWGIAPYFIVADVAAAAAYYRDRLGFAYERFWGDPPSFCMVYRRGVVIMLSQIARAGGSRPNKLADPDGEAWDAYVWVDDADALHAEWVAKGVRIVRPPCDQPYGCRDFEIEDIDGYRLCFGHDTTK